MLDRSSTVRSVIVASALILGLAAAHPPATAAPPARSSVAADAKPIDINNAGNDLLQTVPGIGKSLAERIVAFREKNGAFASVDDLLKIQGIGEKSLEKLRPYLTVTKAK